MSEQINGFEELRQWIDRVIAGVQHPQERRIGYGNLRHEVSEWRDGDEEVTNIAIIYEIPGGSTCQFNLSYSRATSEYSYIDPDSGQKIETTDVEQVRRALEEEIHGIPRKRLKSLLAQVDHWIGEGMSRSDVFAQLNKLLQAEFLGGRINNKELQAAVQHVVKKVQQERARA